jgi:hypothetical protein
MGQTGRDRRSADPWAILTGIGRIDLGEVTRTLATMADPDAGFLDALGRNRKERVEKMATMLRNSSEADIEEMGTIFGLAMAKVAERRAEPPADHPAAAPKRDPLSMWVGGLRRIGSMDLGDISRGLENFTNPSVGALLGSLGRSRDEQVEKMAAMLAKSSEADLEEMGAVYMLAVSAAAEERTTGAEHAEPGRSREERPRRRRGQTAAEWRKERRLAS